MASQSFRGGPSGGQIPHTAIKKAGLWIVFGILGFLCLIGIAIGAVYYRMHKTQVSETPISSVTSTTTRQVVTVTVTDAPHEIDIPFGMDINFKLRTKDVVWWVQPGDGKVFERPPINSPKFKDIDYGNKFESIKVWVAPGTTAELVYYFTPA